MDKRQMYVDHQVYISVALNIHAVIHHSPPIIVDSR